MKAAKRFLSMLLTLCMLLSLLPSTVFAANSNVPFTDVKETDWFYDAVGYVYENGMMGGTGNNQFSPNVTTTRGMIVTILYRLEGSPAVSTASFDDVATGEYYANGVSWAAANGVVSGYGNNLFGPNDPITREQMATILYRYAQYKEYETVITRDVSSFTDGAAVSSYAVEPMNWAVGTGLLSGVGNNMLNPTGNATRAQVATILMRFCDLNNIAPVETYTVTFDYNYSNKGTYKTITVEVGDKVDKPANPTRSGYSFAGWYTKAVGGEKFDFEEAVAEDMTLYARWNENSSGGGDGGHVPPTTTVYTVTFYMNDGTTTVHASSSVSAGNAVAEPPDPVREGYIFDGWYADKELTRDYDFESAVNGDLNLYASWDEENSDEIISDEDADNDSIPAAVEAILGTSDSLDDSDGDGISDYIEIYEIGSDPTVADSDQDTDGDGISNYDEVLKYKTHAGKVDTDGDGLDDYTEIFTCNTDPLIADTDGDGISDGDEVKKLRTDPLSPTDLSSVDQMLSTDNIDDELTSDNDAVPSLHGKADTVLDNFSSLKASKEEAISSNRAIIGRGVEAVIPLGAELMLSFSIDDPEEYYIIMELDEKTGWEPMESYHSGTSVSAEINHNGTYCLVDIEVLLSQLGVDIDSIYDSIMPSSEAVDTESNQVDTAAALNDTYFTNSDSLSVTDNNSSGAVTLDNDVVELVDNGGISVMSTEPMGQADIVFAIDTTGSMSDEISNVANNIITFAHTLSTVYNVNVNFALVDYRDIVDDSPDSTQIVTNGRSNWFTSTSSFRDAVAAMTVDGGGDTPETAIDALEVARRLDFRGSAKKFIVLVTDANYKVNNNFGISSMDEEIQLLAKDGIITSVVTSTGYKSTYQDLIDGTGGIFANINGNFGEELLALADMIGGEVSEGNWILLDDYQFVALSKPLAEDSGSTDGDELSDWEELESPIQKDLTLLVRIWLEVKGVPSKLVDEYFVSEDGVYVTVYPYKSNPVLEDTDYDGIPDDSDPDPRNNTRSGQMYGYYGVDNAKYTMDFRNFSGNLTAYNRELSLASLVFANAVYGEGFNGTDQNTPNITELLEYHGFEHVIDYSLAKPLDEEVRSDFPSVHPYTDDDISEIGIGYHDYEYEGRITRVVAVIVRGTDGSIEEWSSNFDMGDPDAWHSNHHKGFYTTEERIKEFVEEYADVYGVERGANNVIYWITGHSRGAALSNLLAARLIDSGKTVVAYTFATPSTTIDSNKNSSKYNSIFNFANTSDVIAYVPLSQWGFGRYGITKEVSIEDSNLESEWCSTTGQDVYNALNSNLITIAMNRIYNSCSKSWDEVFDRAGKQRINEEQYECISNRARKYCDLKYHDYWLSDDLYELYPSTAFVFQLGAEMLAGNDVEKSNALTLIKELWNSKYMVVLLGLFGDAVGNMGTVIDHWPDDFAESLVGDGHAPATYYVLVQHST